MVSKSIASSVFRIINAVILIILAFVCLLPFVHMVALSFSDSAAVQGGMVGLWPVDFTLESYSYVIEKEAFWRSFGIAIQRVLLGALINVGLVVFLAYPLSKPSSKFKYRTVYVWFFFITMLFSGGLIPTYLVVSSLNLLNNIWALILPGAVNVFNIILVLNFYRQIPQALEEAAYIDGAGHFKTLVAIYLPCSLPVIATITLFSMVNHWNSWFDGLIYMKKAELYPLQSYLQTIIANMNFQTVSATELERLARLNQRSVKTAQMVIAAIPILCVYPFLQKYFITGITLGSVKE